MDFSRRGFMTTLGSLAAAPYAPAAGKNSWVYVGTYTGPNSKGIYLFEWADGKLTPKGVAGEGENPSFLTIHPNKKWLYAADEVNNFDGKKSGAVSSYSIDAQTGKLTLMNQTATKGGGSCFVTVDRTGKNVLVANYGGGSVAVLPLAPDGHLKEASAFIQHTGSGVDPKRQKEPHAHSVNMSPDNRFAIVADLGLDELVVYAFDAQKGSLTPATPFKVKPGSGPRHFTFHPDKTHAYVINEMGSTVVALSYIASNGTFTELQTISTLPADFKGENNTAEVQVHPSGKFLYGSNRGLNSIAIFQIDKGSGKLTLTGNEPTQGKIPRNFRIDPTGRYLIAANQNSNDMIVFTVDQKTGALKPNGEKAELASPVCIKFLS